MRRERLRKLKDFIILGSLGRTQHTAGPHGEAPELVKGQRDRAGTREQESFLFPWEGTGEAGRRGLGWAGCV